MACAGDTLGRPISVLKGSRGVVDLGKTGNGGVGRSEGRGNSSTDVACVWYVLIICTLAIKCRIDILQSTELKKLGNKEGPSDTV